MPRHINDTAMIVVLVAAGRVRAVAKAIAAIPVAGLLAPAIPAAIVVGP